MPETIETERLVLRLRDPDDAAWNLELLGERAGGTTRTLHAARARLAAQAEEARVNGFGFYGIRPRILDSAPIGYCGLLVGRSTVEQPEIAYELFRRAHGQGVATEAARAVLEEASATGRTRIWATVRTGNAPSFRVLDKLGFRRDHVTLDHDGELVWLVREGPTGPTVPTSQR